MNPLSSDPARNKALNLRERLSLGLGAKDRTDCGDIELAKRRLNRWKSQPAFQKSGAFQAELFAQRLAADNITENQLLSLLHEEPSSAPLTAADLVSWICCVENANPPLFQGRLPDATAHSLVSPVIPLLNPALEAVQVHAKLLISKYPRAPLEAESIGKLFSSPALPAQLLSIVLRTFILELNVARLREQLKGESPASRFQCFVQTLCNGENLLAVFEEYPVLARQISTCIRQWEIFAEEILTRLCADWDGILAQFFPAGQPSRVVEIRLGQGDQHCGGRSVAFVRFESGQQVVYKPRSIAIDMHFQELLLWLNQRTQLGFLPGNVLDRGSYGWCEFISRAECKSLVEVQRFYTRLGALLAVLYVLEATDVHFENLIAAADQPVLVDLESLFQARVPGPGHTNGIAESVFRVGLLPMRLWGDEDHPGLDIGGMSAVAGQTTPYSVLRYENAGTDEMRISRRRVNIPAGKHRPTLSGGEVRVEDFENEFIQGFTQTYTELMSAKDELLSDTGILAHFANDEVRTVLRSTRTYSSLMAESLHPNALRDALDRDRVFDHLWAGINQHKWAGEIVTREREQLWNNDIPFFSTTAGSTELRSFGRQPIGNFFEESGMSHVRQRIASLSEDDLARQVYLIRTSIATISSKQPPRVISDQAGMSLPSATELHDRMLDRAVRVGRRLRTLAFRAEGEAVWVGLASGGEQDWLCVDLGLNLYDGLPGVILFLAHLGAITHERAFVDLAKEGFSALRRLIGVARTRMKAVGAFEGWGGVIYALSQLALLWEDPQILQEAAQLVAEISELVQQDVQFDLVRGSAGCIGSLAALHRVQGLMGANSGDVLAAAVACGEHLLKSAEPMQHGIAWKTHLRSTGPLTGFSHGAAGIAWALVQLASVTGEEKFRASAIRALLYEQSTFSSAEENWPDLRIPEKSPASAQTFGMTWCHGAPGIGLARLSTLALLDTELIREEIDAAVRTTRCCGFGQNHSLCHGDLGNVELLMTSGKVLDRRESVAEARHRIASLLRGIDTQGYLCGTPNAVETPGLMTGIAGIGYQLLHFAEPEHVPSVLTLDSIPAAKNARTG